MTGTARSADRPRPGRGPRPRPARDGRWQAELHGRDVGYRPAHRRQRIRRQAAIDAGQVDREGRLRWASASDQTAQTLEDGQERLAQGPCMVAFSQRAPAAIRDISHEPQWGELGRVLVGEGIGAALSAPVEVDGSAIGTLDSYSSAPWDWDDSEIAALQTYAGLAASLLTAAVTA